MWKDFTNSLGVNLAAHTAASGVSLTITCLWGAAVTFILGILAKVLVPFLEYIGVMV